jgi:endonuclease/exonuclease/phosphatase family metal-dependent hydrolase
VASTICVATLNCRNRSDRWPQRRHLLVEQLARLQPDLIGLQELRRWPSQGSWIARRLNEASPGSTYRVHSAYKTGVWQLWEGIAILTRLPVVETDSLDLDGDNRVACLTRVDLPDGGVLDGYCTHLPSRARNEELRTVQAGRILDWMDERPGTPRVLVGDLNARPQSPTVAALRERLRSAYAVVHGREPEATTPTPLRGPPAGAGVVIDYIFVNEPVEVLDATVTFDQAHPEDARLYASDHYGVAATIAVGG